MNKSQPETNISILAQLALDHFFTKNRDDYLPCVTSWEKILIAYPNVKEDILTFYKDLIKCNPDNWYPCCSKSVIALLNSCGAYFILIILNDFHWTPDTYPESLGALTWLTEICFYEHTINTPKLPAVFMKLTNLEELSIYENKITELPQKLVELTKLKKLTVVDNLLEKLPDGLGGLTALTELEITCPKFKILPEEIGKLTNLRLLNFGYNDHRYRDNGDSSLMPTSIVNLTNLKHLDWGPKPYAFLPTAFGKFLTKREGKCNFTICSNSSGFEARYSNGKIEPIQIYTKQKISNPDTLKYRYLGRQNEEDGFFEGELSILLLDISSIPELMEKTLLKELCDRNEINLIDIRCDKFCNWEDGTHFRCEGVIDKWDQYNTGEYCDLEYWDYKFILSDCYYRYHEHLKKRSLLNMYGEVMYERENVNIPSDISCYIANIIYAVEEKELIDTMHYFGSFLNVPNADPFFPNFA